MSLDIKDITFELKVSEIVEETTTARSISFEIPPELKERFKYSPGQFVSIFMDIKGETISRSYSLGSAPISGEPFKVTVKRVPGGKGSNYLCDHVSVGDKLRLAPPSGHFFKHKPNAKHFALYGAGSGITPLFSILKTVLTNVTDSSIHLVYSNRSEDQIIYFNEIREWQKKYPSRLHVTHLLSQPTPAWTELTSRCSENWLQNFLKTLPSDVEHYVCGPESFMHMVEATFKAKHVPTENFHKESFATPTANPTLFAEDGVTRIGKENPVKADSYSVSVTLQGETKNYQVKKDETILEAIIEAGDNPPYSCMDGACMACMAKVTAGCVIQNDPGILTEENIAVGECLTCQAKPRSHNLQVTYDIF